MKYRRDRDHFQAQRWNRISSSRLNPSHPTRVTIKSHDSPTGIADFRAQIVCMEGFIDQDDIPYLSTSTTRLGMVCFLTVQKISWTRSDFDSVALCSQRWSTQVSPLLPLASGSQTWYPRKALDLQYLPRSNRPTWRPRGVMSRSNAVLLSH